MAEDKQKQLATTVQVADLQPWDKNPREIDKDKFEALCKYIKKWGLLTPLLVDNRDKKTVLGGNMRLKALKELGIKEVEVKYIDVKSDDEAIEVALLDNNQFGNYIADKLSVLIEDVDIELEDFQIDLAPISLGSLVVEEEPEVQEDDFDPDSVEKNIHSVQLGDVYQLGEHRLMCGDSTKIEDVEKLMDGQKADMVFTDPPYGINLQTSYTYAKGWGERNIKPTKGYQPIINDDKDFNYKEYDWLDCEEQFWWGADYYVDTLPNYGKDGSWIIWDKKNDQTSKFHTSEFETLWSKQKHKKQVLRVLWNGALGMESEDTKNRVHPTQKPTRVFTPIIIQYSEEEDIVLDLFGGSGSTLIACEQTNRKCYMMELDPHYVSVIIERWEKLTNQKAKKIIQ